MASGTGGSGSMSGATGSATGARPAAAVGLPNC
jgi:hypothetical protein